MAAMNPLLASLLAMGGNQPAPAPAPIEPQPTDLRGEILRELLEELGARRSAQVSELSQPAPAPVEPDPLSKGDIISRGILGALSTYAAGINPRGGQSTDYLARIRDRRQEEADRKTVLNRQGFEDSRRAALLTLQDIIGQEDVARGDLTYTRNRADALADQGAANKRRDDEIAGARGHDIEMAELNAQLDKENIQLRADLDKGGKEPQGDELGQAMSVLNLKTRGGMVLDPVTNQPIEVKSILDTIRESIDSGRGIESAYVQLREEFEDEISEIGQSSAAKAASIRAFNERFLREAAKAKTRGEFGAPSRNEPKPRGSAPKRVSPTGQPSMVRM